MHKLTRSILALSAFIGTSCVAMAPGAVESKPIRVGGHTEKLGPPSEEKNGTLSLTHRSILELPAPLAREISAIDFWQGQARLTNGRCLHIEIDQKTLEEVGATIHADPSQCDNLIKYPLLVSRPCAAEEKNISIGTWRIGCRTTNKNRSVIVATKLDDPTWKLELLSLPDQELIAVGVMPLHDQGIVRTLGIRSDGKIALSQYLWFNGPYRPVAKPQ